MSAKCVFLDRDNTIIDDPGYLTHPAAVKLLPGADQALRSLVEAGWKLVIVSNQSAIARGLLTEEGLDRVHGELRRQLRERGVNLDGIYFCPYHPEGTVERYAKESPDRKPHPGIFQAALDRTGLEAKHTMFVGDSLTADIVGARRMGMVAVLKSRHEVPVDASIRPDHQIARLSQLPQVLDQYQLPTPHPGGS